MKICRFTYQKRVLTGIIDSNLVYKANKKPDGLYFRTSLSFPLSEVKLLAPSVPKKVICVGVNYHEHAKDGHTIPKEPILFLKPSSATCGPSDIIRHPGMSAQVDFEGELAVVIRKKAHRISPDQANEHILGYTCANDITARDIQNREGIFTRAKGFETFAPFGPWIETDLDPTDLTLETVVNGCIVQKASTQDMVFSIPEIVSYTSQIMTLHAGDLIMTGTPRGMGAMNAGDSVKVSISGIGTLHNTMGMREPAIEWRDQQREKNRREKREMFSNKVADLSANENPLGPSTKVKPALMAHLDQIHRYPDGEAKELKGILSQRLNVVVNRIVLGNGSCELIDLAARVCLKPGDRSLSPLPGFNYYRSAAKRVRAEFCGVPLQDGKYNLDAFVDRINEKTRIIFLGNPNNPTGCTIGQDELDRFLSKVPGDVLVVLDEAYKEFVRRSDFPNSLEYIDRGDNVLVLRSFSKAYGLAGLRLGYGVGSPELIKRLDGMKQYYNTCSLAHVAAIETLKDDQYLEKTQNATWEGIDFLSRELNKLGLDFMPSDGNFLLVDVGDGKHVCRELAKRSIKVKEMDLFQLPDYVRVSVGRAEENRHFIRSLKEIL
jgi:histidinol-phosphate aminotransferase